MGHGQQKGQCHEALRGVPVRVLRGCGNARNQRPGLGLQATQKSYTSFVSLVPFQTLNWFKHVSVSQAPRRPGPVSFKPRPHCRPERFASLASPPPQLIIGCSCPALSGGLRIAPPLGHPWYRSLFEAPVMTDRSGSAE
eukprot:9478768-Pyramimonas_sp.AAC.1